MPGVIPLPPRPPQLKRTTDVLQKPDNSKSYRQFSREGLADFEAPIGSWMPSVVQRIRDTFFVNRRDEQPGQWDGGDDMS